VLSYYFQHIKRVKTKPLTERLNHDKGYAEQAAYMNKKAEDGLRRHGYRLVPVENTGAARLVRI
jgi:hypothetical protein